jgi:hypothetical protein
MISRIEIPVLAATGLVAGVFASQTRVAPKPNTQQPASLTGCLGKGMAQDTFSLKTKDGKTYWLSSSTVQLSQHVGHTVTVTGAPAKATPGKEPSKDTMETGMAAGPVNVSKLSMVSESCK